MKRVISFLKSIRILLEFPFLADYVIKHNWYNRLPLVGGIHFSWGKFGFHYPESNEYFPRKLHEGTHWLTIYIGFMYWSMKIVFYKSVLYNQSNYSTGEATYQDIKDAVEQIKKRFK